MTSTKVTLITGATGLVGNNIVRLLRAQGELVRVLVRGDTHRRPLLDLDLEIVGGDVCDEQAVRRACDGAAVVIHCAGHVRIGWSQPQVYRDVNVTGTRHVAEACRANGARLVHVSSTDVFGRCALESPTDEDTPEGVGPLVPYVATKREAERVVAEQLHRGLDAVIVNPSFMLGPWDWKPSSGRMLLAVARGRAFMAPRGYVSLSDARDVAAGVLAARDRGIAGRRYILAGRTLELIEVFRIFADVCGTRRPLCRVGPIASWIGGWGGDCLGRLAGSEPDINSAAVALARLPKNYSSARAQAELDYRIRPAQQTVRDAWHWFQEHGYG